MSVRDRSAEDDELAIAWLTARIQDLSAELPMWSRSAYTHRRTVHVSFVNGYRKEQDEKAHPPIGNVRDVAEQTLQAVRQYRAQITGAVSLVWRMEPMIEHDEHGWSLFTRLCFEPSL